MSTGADGVGRPDSSDGDTPPRRSARRRGRSDDRREGGKSPGGAVVGFLKETTIVLAIALVLSVLLKTFLIQAFYIPSESMQNTLQVGDRLIVNKLKPDHQELRRGDIVVFVDPGGWLRPQNQEPPLLQKALTWVGLLPQHANEHLIKRVIGMPGDHVECCDEEGRILVNGEPLDETYIYPGADPSLKEFDVTVPAAHLWLLGDNRPRSQDSRYSEGAVGGGFVPVRNVVGTAWVIIWPFEHMTVLKNPAATFAGVPSPA